MDCSFYNNPFRAFMKNMVLDFRELFFCYYCICLLIQYWNIMEKLQPAFKWVFYLLNKVFHSKLLFKKHNLILFCAERACVDFYQRQNVRLQFFKLVDYSLIQSFWREKYLPELKILPP